MMIHGVFGMIKLVKFTFLIVIKDAKKVGRILTADIFRVENLQFIPLSGQHEKKKLSEDSEYIEMIQKIQEEKCFYFSYDMDLTKNMEKTISKFSDRPN